MFKFIYTVYALYISKNSQLYNINYKESSKKKFERVIKNEDIILCSIKKTY